MTRIESEEAIINKPATELYNFLSDFNNFKSIMPEQVVNWESTQDDCSFTIKGMASLGMQYEEKIPSSLIKIKQKGKAPFDFTIHCMLDKQDESNTKLKLAMDADLNPFLKMMAEKPLKKFLDTLVSGYQKLN
jgi:carbon monoxide dehydrogenase subunit G